MNFFKDHKFTKVILSILFAVAIFSAFHFGAGFAIQSNQTQVVHVDGESMAPTLKDGQEMTVDKSSKIGFGDIVVVRTEQEGDIVKRVIGLPGDKIEFKDNQIFRNGTPITHFHSEEAIEQMEIPLEGETFVELDNDSNLEYYILGDNLTHGKSIDSRQLGEIFEEDILGEVVSY